MNDALYDVILGAQPAKGSAPPPQAGSAKTNQYNVGNLRPVGSSTGFQQPSSYEEGIKAMDNNLMVYGTKHGINTLRGVISRYAPPQDKNDTEGYINFVAQKTGLKPDQKIDLSNPAVRHVISGPMILMEKGGKNIFGASSPQQKQMVAVSDDPLYNIIAGTKTKETPAVQEDLKKALETPTEDLTKPVTFNRKLARQGEKMREQGSKLQPFVKEVAKPLEEITAEDYAKKSTPAIWAKLNYGTDQQKQEALDTIKEGSKKFIKGASDFINAPNKGEIIKQGLAEIAKNPGKFIGESVKSVAYHPEQIVVGNVAGKAVGDVAGKTIGQVKNVAETVAQTPAYQGLVKKTKGATETIQESFEAYKKAQAQQKVSAPVSTPAVASVAPTLTGVGAAKVEINPYTGKITGEEVARGQYPVVKLSKIKEDAPASEQQIRSQIANEVLGDTGQVRSGVITGNENILRQEYTEARSANPTLKSEILKKQIADEQNSLTRYAEKRIEASGASRNLPSDYERGQLMNDAIAGDDGLTGFLKTQKEELYNNARNKVGDNPIQTNSVDNLLKNKQFRAGLGLKNNEGVAKSAEQLIELARTVGFEDRVGNILPPNSIASWKAVREALNAEWTKDNASVIRKINDAIDQDIAKAGGLDLYKKADNLHKAEKKIFESKGIKTLFGEVDPNGVQTATNFEAIPKKLNSMPVDQWKHIYDTYDEISKGRVRGADFDLEITPELVQYAEAAKAEMRGALAREIYQAGAGKAGTWNQNSVNNILNSRAKKIEHSFTPDEQRAFHTLNYAGHIMPGVHAYEGAALQGQRVNKFAEKLPMIGREAGAATRIPFGATIGEKVGEKSEGFFKGRTEKTQAKQLQEEMAKNAQKGKTNLKDIGKE